MQIQPKFVPSREYFFITYACLVPVIPTVRIMYFEVFIVS